MNAGSMTRSAEPLPLRMKMSYGVGALGIAVIYGVLLQLLFYYYTDVYGLTPKEAGLVSFLATLWDGIVDPIVAWITSQTKSRLGRYRPWLIFGAAPVTLAFVLVFMRPGWAAGELFLVALCAQFLFRTLYQAVFLPYTALVAQLTTVAAERSVAASYKAWFVTFGQLVIAGGALTLVDVFGGADAQRGFLITAAIVAAISGICILQAGLFTREVETVGDAAVHDEPHPAKALGAVLRNRYAMMVAGAVLIFSLSTVIVPTGLIYIFQYDLGHRDDARLALSSIYVAGLIASPVWANLTRRFGKQLGWLGGCLTCGTMLVVAALAHPSSTPAFCAIFFVYGLGLQAIWVVMFASMADAVDYGEWRLGRRAEAMSFGVLTSINKASLAMSGGLLGLMLTWIGFRPNHVQSPETLHGLRLAIFLLPAFFWFATAALMAFYRLSNRLHAEARTSLEQRRASNVPAARSVIVDGDPKC